MIYRLQERDLDEIEKLIETEFPYLRKPRLHLEYKLISTDFFLYKILHNNRLAGFCEFETLKDRPRTVRLNGLAVLPELRRQGIGKKLLAESVCAISKTNAKTIYLMVKRENTVARKLYEQNGFEHKGTLSEKIDDAVVEEYELKL